MPRVTFDKFAVDVPQGWIDVTDSLEMTDSPHTLARPDGVGALQFSIALYQSGPEPNPSPEVLREMVEEFGASHGLGEPSAVVVESGPLRLAAGSFSWDDDFLRVWQVSDGKSFAFVTYTCSANDVGPEVAECEMIVRTIVFGSQ